MPVKWDPGMDQLLLLKILETHELKVDTKKISAAWPDNRGETPSARAIQERLVKIRSNARANGAGTFGISSAQSKGTSPGKPRSTPQTPSKPKANGTVASISPSKRKASEDPPIKPEPEDTEVIDTTTPAELTPAKARMQISQEIADIVNSNNLTTPTKHMSRLSVDAPDRDSIGHDEDGYSPSKRPRRASAQKVVAYGSDGDAGGDSDGSVFNGGMDGANDDEEVAV